MDASKFHLWRACFAFCSVDSFVDPKEKKWLEEKKAVLKFTANELAILEKDLKAVPNMHELLSLITKPSDRSFLIDQMRVLAHIDGTLSEPEKKKIQELKDIVLSKVNLKELDQRIAQVETVESQLDFLDRVHRYITSES